MSGHKRILQEAIYDVSSDRFAHVMKRIAVDLC